MAKFNHNNLTNSDILAALSTKVPLVNDETETASSIAFNFAENPLQSLWPARTPPLLQETPILEPELSTQNDSLIL